MAAPSMKGIFDDAPAPDEESDEPMQDDESAESEYPPEYDAAYDEWESNPTKDTMWRMIDACANGKSGGGLALLIGPKGKGKK